MKMNWKVRFKNKVWLTAFISAIVTFIFTILSMFDIFPAITENQIMRVVNAILMFLSLTGVVVDPTTAGVGDSDRALSYEEPWDDDASNDILDEEG